MVEFTIERLKKSVYKLAQACPVIVVANRTRGFSDRSTLINLYNE